MGPVRTLAGAEAPHRRPRPSTAALQVFVDAASGFSTSDVRDAQEQIVQFNTAGELIWTADGTRFAGYSVGGIFINADRLCQCRFEVRFGTNGGERRAYLTADYGHENPGTLVDLDVVSGALVAGRSSVGPAGSYTLSGIVTAVTVSGLTPDAEASGSPAIIRAGGRARRPTTAASTKSTVCMRAPMSLWRGRKGIERRREASRSAATSDSTSNCCRADWHPESRIGLLLSFGAVLPAYFVESMA